MKILLVTGIFPPDIGGPASYIPAIASELAQRHEILGVVTLSDRLDHDDAHYGYPVYRLPRRMNQLARRLLTIARIRELARRADVVYMNGLDLEGVLACKVLSRRPLATKVVGDRIWEEARFRGSQVGLDAFQRDRQGFRWELLKKLQAWYIGRTDAVVTPSAYLAGIVAGWGVAREKIHVVYNAIEALDAPSAPDGPARYDLVTVSRLVEHKCLDAVIGVAAAHRLSCLIVGDGPMRAPLQALAERLEAPVTFHGAADKSEIPALMRQGKLFVLNSIYEGLPHVVLEAQALGVPVVATAVGGTPETIRDGEDGWLVPVNDADALSARLLGALADEGLRGRVAAAGRAHVAARFSYARMIEETERLLVRLGGAR